MTVHLTSGMATDIGRVRAINQDAAGIQDQVVVVADGMGGHNGGEIASEVAVESFLEAHVEPTVLSVVGAVNRANDAVLLRADEDPDLAGMGTTLCVLAAVETDEGERLCAANVGDSRVYLLADGALQQISEDHSLVAGLVRQGRLRPEEAERHPQRNILTRALGVEPRVLVDAWEIVPVAGDRFLLCSDGLFNEVPDDRIAATLRRLADPQEAAEELVRLANEGGGRDNITVVVADVVADSAAELDVGATRLTRTRRSIADVAGFSLAGPSSDDTIEHAEDEAAPGPAVVDAESLAAARAIEAAEPDAAAPAKSSRAMRSFRPSRPTWRALLFVALLAAVGVVAVATLAAFSNSGFYVGVDGGEVVIFEGKPGGFLWMEPSVAERSGLPVDDLAAEDVAAVEDGVERDSLGQAQTYVEEVRRRADAGATAAGGDSSGGSVGDTADGQSPTTPTGTDPDVDL